MKAAALCDRCRPPRAPDAEPQGKAAHGRCLCGVGHQRRSGTGAHGHLRLPGKSPCPPVAPKIHLCHMHLVLYSPLVVSVTCERCLGPGWPSLARRRHTGLARIRAGSPWDKSTQQVHRPRRYLSLGGVGARLPSAPFVAMATTLLISPPG